MKKTNKSEPKSQSSHDPDMNEVNKNLDQNNNKNTYSKVTSDKNSNKEINSKKINDSYNQKSEGNEINVDNFNKKVIISNELKNENDGSKFNQPNEFNREFGESDKGLNFNEISVISPNNNIDNTIIDENEIIGIITDKLDDNDNDNDNNNNKKSINLGNIDDSKEDDEQNSRNISLDKSKLLKNLAKYQNEAKISEIESYLEKIKEYEDPQNMNNNFKFKEIEHEDVIDFTKEETLNFFKARKFILSENSKRRLNLLYFCIKHGFHILIPGPTGTGKTYLSEAICDLLKKKMIKYNCSENTKFPNLKFTCQGDKNKFAGIKYIKGPLLEAITSKNTAFRIR
jgi:hypothetical protein